MPPKTHPCRIPTYRNRGNGDPLLLELLRRTVAQRRMQTLPIVDRFQERLQFLLQLFQTAILPTVELLPFQCTDKALALPILPRTTRDRKSTRLNSSHLVISYAVFCLKKT